MRGRWIPLPKSQTGVLLTTTVTLLVIIVAVGVLGYEIFEDMGFIDSLYATLNTITTVGRGMDDFTTLGGELVSMIVMVLGVITAMLVLGLITRAMIEGQLQQIVGRKRMEKQIASLKDHVVLCGYGRMGRVVARELGTDKTPFVVIEQDDAVFGHIEEDGHLGFHGDAASDQSLVQCGVPHARALIFSHFERRRQCLRHTVGPPNQSRYLYCRTRERRQRDRQTHQGRRQSCLFTLSHRRPPDGDRGAAPQRHRLPR